MTNKPPSAKHIEFAHEYLKNGMNAKRAYASVYKTATEATAETQGPKLLRKPQIQEIIQTHQRELEDARKSAAEKLGIDEMFILSGLKQVIEKSMESNVKMKWNPKSQEYEPVCDEDGNIIHEYDSGGANKALELMGKHLQMFTDKVVQTGSMDIVCRLPDGVTKRAVKKEDAQTD